MSNAALRRTEEFLATYDGADAYSRRIAAALRAVVAMAEYGLRREEEDRKANALMKRFTPRGKRGARTAEHVCDYRCTGDSGHHAWPSPSPRVKRGKKR